MADSDKAPKKATGDQRRRTSAAGRQDGDYAVEITGAKGGPIPESRPIAAPVEKPAK